MPVSGIGQFLYTFGGTVQDNEAPLLRPRGRARWNPTWRLSSGSQSRSPALDQVFDAFPGPVVRPDKNGEKQETILRRCGDYPKMAENKAESCNCTRYQRITKRG